jgi:hypothetical protein
MTTKYEENMYESDSDREEDKNMKTFTFDEEYEDEIEVVTPSQSKTEYRAPKPILSLRPLVIIEETKKEEVIPISTGKKWEKLEKVEVAKVGVEEKVDEFKVIEKKKKKNTVVVATAWLESKRESDRSCAFTVLSDRKELGQKLTKTKMCKSILDKEVCPHGTGCRFAHDLSEIVTCPCIFNSQCRLVSLSDGVYKNKSGGKMCGFQHPNESIEHYRIRVGLVKEEVKPKIELPTMSRARAAKLAVIPPLKAVKVEKTDEEEHITISRDMAEKMFGAALSGKKVIHVTIQ